MASTIVKRSGSGYVTTQTNGGKTTSYSSDRYGNVSNSSTKVSSLGDPYAQSKAKQQTQQQLTNIMRGGGTPLPSNLAPYVDSKTGKVDVVKAAEDAKRNPGLINTYSASGKSGGSGASTITPMTPLELVQQEAITGKTINIPRFPNTPAGIVARGNFVSGIAKIKADLEANKPNAVNILFQSAQKKGVEAQKLVESTKQRVNAYNKEGEVIKSKAQQLQEEANNLNVRNPAQVNAFNQKVNAFNKEINDYTARGKEINNQVNKVNNEVANYEASVKNAERMQRIQPNASPTFFDTLKIGEQPVKINNFDTKSPSVVSGSTPGVYARKELDVLTSNKINPQGRKLKVETAESLLKQGAFGTVIEQEALATDISKNPIKKIGLEIASVPAMFGQRSGQAIASIITGGKKEFSGDLDTKFVYESQGSGGQIAEVYSLKKSVQEYKKSFRLDPVGTSIGVGLDALILAPGIASVAGAKLVSKSKLLQKGVKGIDVVAAKTDSAIARALYTGKELAMGSNLKSALKTSKGITLGTLRTDVVSKLIGRKTIKLENITSKDIAKAFVDKGKSQYLKFSGSEKQLFQKAITGKEAKFIKNTFKNLNIGKGDVIGFSAESGKATGFIEAVLKKGKVQYRFVGSEPYGKFFASRTATGPLTNLINEQNIRVVTTGGKVPSPSVTVGIGEKGVLTTKGGIKGSVKALGYDVSKTNLKIQKYFDDALKAGARPPKLKELRSIFGEKEVAKGYVTGVLDIKGKLVSSPSRIYKLTGEEEFIAPFSTRTKLLGNLKERVFGSAIVDVAGKRIKLNVKKLLPEIVSDVKSTSSLLKAESKALKAASRVTSVPSNIKLVNITPIIQKTASVLSVGSGLSGEKVSYSIPKLSNVSFSGLDVSVPNLSSSSVDLVKVSSVSGVSSVSSSSVPISISSGTSKIDTSISSSNVSKATEISTSINKLSVPVSISSGLSKTSNISSISSASKAAPIKPLSTSVPKVSISTSKLSITTPRISSKINSVSSSTKPISKITPRISTGTTSIPSKPSGRLSKVKGISSKSPKLRSNKYSIPKTSYRTPRLSTKSPRFSTKTPSLPNKYVLSQGTTSYPKYKEEKLVKTKGYQSKDLYFETSSFKDIKKMNNRTNLMGFKTRNDFSISNVFKKSNLFKKENNLKKSNYTNVYNDKNKYNYKNEYDVSIKYKNYKPYKYSTKLIDTDKFNTKIKLKY